MINRFFCEHSYALPVGTQYLKDGLYDENYNPGKSRMLREERE